MTLLINCNSVGELLDIIHNLRDTGATIEQEELRLHIHIQPITIEIETIVKETREKWNPDMAVRGRYEEAPRLQTYGELKGLRGGANE